MLNVVDLGLVDYLEALKIQENTAASLKDQSKTSIQPAGNIVGTLLFCTHPAVVTLGRKTTPEDLTGWSGPIYEIARGGRATYHGPSQLVLYPILNLAHPALPKQKDLSWYLRALENSIIEVLREFGVASEGRSLRDPSAARSETGVWVNVEGLPDHVRAGHHQGFKKIASLGIGIKDWITFHGAAFNLDDDPAAFQGLNPCGFSPSVMVNLESILRRPIDRTEVKRLWSIKFQGQLDLSTHPTRP